MKKVTLFFLLIFVSNGLLLANTFTKRDGVGVIYCYNVDAKFLKAFGDWIRDQPVEYRPPLIDVYRALQNGESIVYNPDDNTFTGHIEWQSISKNQLKQLTSGKGSRTLDATFDNWRHRFRCAISRLDHFVYYTY